MTIFKNNNEINKFINNNNDTYIFSNNNNDINISYIAGIMIKTCPIKEQ